MSALILKRSLVEASFTAHGMGGFGRSDTRAALRAFFEVDRQHIVVAALSALASQDDIAKEEVAEPTARYEGDVSDEPPWTR